MKQPYEQKSQRASMRITYRCRDTHVLRGLRDDRNLLWRRAEAHLILILFTNADHKSIIS